MKKPTQGRLALILLIAMLLIISASACGSEPPPRLSETFTYNPGAQFQTNLLDSDPRRIVRCTVMFEVVDAQASEDLAAYNSAIRNAVLTVLGGLTLEEVTERRDLADISQRLVEQANQAVSGVSSLIIAAYFTEFQIA